MSPRRIGERRLGHAAAVMASVDRGAVFGHLQARLGEIEDLAALHVRHHRGRQVGLAMLARHRRVTLDAVGPVHRPQGVAFVAGLRGRSSYPTGREGS